MVLRMIGIVGTGSSGFREEWILLRDQPCEILVKKGAGFCSWPKLLPEDKLKSKELTNVAEEI